MEVTVDKRNPRDWYYALMDYGVMLKASGENANRRSASHSVQSKFDGSDRQIRGLIIKTLVAEGEISQRQITKIIGKRPERVKRIISDLMAEGFLLKRGEVLSINEE